MNKGVFAGAGARPIVGFGKLTYGIDYQNKDYAPVMGQKTYVTNAPADLKRIYPKITLKQHFTPFLVVDIIWTGSLWAAISATQFSTTTDFITWSSPVTLPANTGYVWRMLGYNGSQYVVIGTAIGKRSPFDTLGASVYTAYSTAGTTWTAGSTLTGFCASTGALISALLWDGTAWIASIMQHDSYQTDYGGMIRSTNGSTWTTVFSGRDVKHVSGTSSLLLATTVPGTTEIYKSTDHGVTWTRAGYASSAHPFCYVNSTWVVSTRNGRLMSSANGTSWTGTFNLAAGDDDNILACANSPVMSLGSYWLRAFVNISARSGYDDVPCQGENLLSVSAGLDQVPVVYDFYEVPMILNGVYAANSRAFMYTKYSADDEFMTAPFIGEVIIDPSTMQVPLITWDLLTANNLYVKVR
jgi:hypothetical protein